jgi:hypothetical protein
MDRSSRTSCLCGVVLLSGAASQEAKRGSQISMGSRGCFTADLTALLLTGRDGHA